MESLGVTDYAFNQKTGVVTIRGRSLDAAEINRAYSTTVLKTQAKKFGWSVKQEPNGKFTVLKARL